MLRHALAGMFSSLLAAVSLGSRCGEGAVPGLVMSLVGKAAATAAFQRNGTSRKASARFSPLAVAELPARSDGVVADALASVPMPDAPPPLLGFVVLARFALDVARDAADAERLPTWNPGDEFRPAARRAA
jgi:hypothetical protein